MSLIHCKTAWREGLKLLDAFGADEQNLQQIAEAGAYLAQAFRRGGLLLACGNGGSACDAMHVAQEFTGRFRKDRPALPAISLTDPTHMSCVGNDFGFEEVFARGVDAYGRKGDVLIALSTSGNSPNVIRALQRAREREMYCLCLLGRDGGSLKGQADLEWIIPGSTSDRIQEVHMFILHLLIEETERLLYPENYPGMDSQ